MIEIEHVTIRLGEKDYTIQEAPRIRSRPWKERMVAEIQPIFAQVGAAKDMSFGGPEDLLQLMPLLETVLLRALDSVYALLIAYSPELEADQEYIESHATDKQVLAAFQEVVKLADPFGMVNLFQQQIGRRQTTTLSNSRSPVGASR